MSAPTTVFGALANSLTILEAQVSATVSAIKNEDLTGFDSLDSMARDVANSKIALQKELLNIMNQLTMTTGIQAASASSASQSGMAISVKQTISFVMEIQKAATCFSKLGKIILQLAQIPILLAAKAVEFVALLAKLGGQKMMSYISSLSTDITSQLQSAKASAISSVMSSFTSAQSSTIDTNIKSLNSQLLIAKQTNPVNQQQVSILTDQINSLIKQKALLVNQVLS